MKGKTKISESEAKLLDRATKREKSINHRLNNEIVVRQRIETDNKINDTTKRTTTKIYKVDSNKAMDFMKERYGIDREILNKAIEENSSNPERIKAFSDISLSHQLGKVVKDNITFFTKE